MITGIILAGGQSRRMGGDKGLSLLNGKRLVSYAIETLKKVCDPIIIGVNSDAYKTLGFQIVKDEFDCIGPVGGIYSCLKISTTDENFILSCDMPLVSEGLIRFVFTQSSGYDAVIPVFNGLQEPLCAFYRKSIVPVVENQINRRIYKIQDVVRPLKVNYPIIGHDLDFYDEHLFHNINTPEDLVNMETRLKMNLQK